jgi:homoserine kinase
MTSLRIVRVKNIILRSDIKDPTTVAHRFSLKRTKITSKIPSAKLLGSSGCSILLTSSVTVVRALDVRRLVMEKTRIGDFRKAAQLVAISEA